MKNVKIPHFWQRTLCDLERYRVTQPIVAELKILEGVCYPKEISIVALGRKLNKIYCLKSEIRLALQRCFNT